MLHFTMVRLIFSVKPTEKENIYRIKWLFWMTGKMISNSKLVIIFKVIAELQQASSNSSHSIMFAFGQKPLGKVWTSLPSQLWVK